MLVKEIELCCIFGDNVKTNEKHSIMHLSDFSISFYYNILVKTTYFGQIFKYHFLWS